MSKPSSKKGCNPSERQKMALIEFLKKRPNLNSGKFSNDFTFKDSENLWKEVAIILNSIPNGAQKEWKEWRKSWQDLKSRTKTKVSKKINHRRGTGGGPFIDDGLTKVEEDIHSIIGTIAIEGHNIQESKVNVNISTLDVICADDRMEIIKETAPKETFETVYQTEGEGVAGPSDPIDTPISRATVRRKIPKRGATKFKHTLAAAGEYKEYLCKKSAIKENYYIKKLELLSDVCTLKKRSVEALERIANAVESFAEI